MCPITINKALLLQEGILKFELSWTAVTSEAFRQQLTSCGLTQSLSGVHHCYDNARMESFFATLKKDLLYKIPTYKMRMEDVKAAIFYYVFVYYNKTRIYTTNPDALPPAVYRALCELTNVVAA